MTTPALGTTAGTVTGIPTHNPTARRTPRRTAATTPPEHRGAASHLAHVPGHVSSAASAQAITAPESLASLLEPQQQAPTAAAGSYHMSGPLPQQIEQLTRADWWRNLQPTEQNSVRAESANLVASLVTYGQSRIAIGKALAMIHTVLEPHGVFVKYLANFNFSLTTAYRYMAIYRNARASLPEIVLREAMASGIDIVGSRDDRPLGQYTEAVAAAPPVPKNPTPEKARAWLIKVQEIKAAEKKPVGRAGAAERAGVGGVVQGEAGEGGAGGGVGSGASGMPDLAETDLEPRLRETYLVVRRAIRKLAPGVRGEFVARLAGLAMGEFDIRGPLALKPTAVPEDWIRARGRPRAG